MKIKVKLFANFREAAKQKEIEVSPEGDNVKAVITGLTVKYPNLEPLLFQDGALKPYVNVLHNGTAVKAGNGLAEKVKNGDEIALFPPVSGG